MKLLLHTVGNEISRLQQIYARLQKGNVNLQLIHSLQHTPRLLGPEQLPNRATGGAMKNLTTLLNAKMMAWDAATDAQRAALLRGNAVSAPRPNTSRSGSASTRSVI